MAAPSPMPCKVGAAWTEVSAGVEGIARSGGLIDRDDAIAAGIASLGATVGVDTEFMRVRTFYPIPALYQLAGADEDGVVLVDGQAGATFDPLKVLLSDPDRTKVMHACSEDLEVIAAHLSLRPVNLIDTQVAHAFLVPEYSVGYTKLVEHYLGHTLDQHATRSDWLQRPLSAAQIQYAREDAAYLVPIWQRQCEALTELGRLGWVKEEMGRVLATPPETPDTWYRTIKGIWRLSGHQLAVLRSLVRWREREARRRDAPRAWVVADEALLGMARRERLTAPDTAELLPRRVAARYGDALARAHREGLDDPATPARAPRPLKQAASAVVKEMRSLATDVAERLGMAPELLARKRDLEAVFRHHRDHAALPDWFGGWRTELLGDGFAEVLRGHG